MKSILRQIHFTITAATIFLSAFNFNGCTLGNPSYERISAEINGEEAAFEYGANGYISQDGYYVLSAYNSDSTRYMTIIFPDDGLSAHYVPYDEITGITLHDRTAGKRWSACVYGGEAEIYLHVSPDSVFRELSGTFYGSLVNDIDGSDTVIVENGEFVFLF